MGPQSPKMGCCLMFRMVFMTYITSIVLASSYSRTNSGLTRIPGSIPAKTTHLYLKQNRIKTISRSSLVALKNIKLLDISRNILHNVEPNSFTGLTIKTLVLSYNQLAIVPHIEPLAYSLTSLDLRNNLITTVEQLTFKNFTLLAWLRLSANSITSLPGFALHMPLTTLSHVYIDGNRIVSLNNFAFAGLRTHYMILNNNELTEFPCLSNITKLDNLHLYGNPISTVPTDCGQ